MYRAVDKTLFEDLVQSLQEAKAIARGEAEPSCRFVVKRMDVKAIREKPDCHKTSLPN